MTDHKQQAQAIARMPMKAAMAEIAALPDHEKSVVVSELSRQHGSAGRHIGQVIANLPMIVKTMPAELAGT